MQLEKVTVNFHRKKNLGNYESADASCMLTAFVEPGDDTQEVQAELWRMAKENVKYALAQYFTDVTADELLLGLNIEQTPKLDRGVNDAN
jgi:hypothetical protein